MTEDVKELQNTVLTLQEKNKRLEAQLAWFKRQAFGQKSEKLKNPENLDIFGKKVEAAPETEEISYTRKKPSKGHGRNSFPEHLEVKEEIVDVSDEEKICPCCGKEKKCIGSDESVKFEAVPATVFLKKIIRPKYACANCPEEGVTQKNMPKQVIDGGNCGTSLINHVIINKYLNHFPLERQHQDFKRQGVHIAPSTMVGWITKFCDVMAVIYEHMKSEVKSSRWIHTDDTGVPVKIKRKKGKAHKGIFWVYVGEDVNAVLEYTYSRSGKGPRLFLEGFTGYMHADGFPGYDRLYKDGHIKECACWSHGRRYFYEAYVRGDIRAKRVLDLCGRLFLVERYMKKNKFIVSQIEEIRNRISKKMIAQIKKWMDDNDLEILPDHDLGKAVSYMRTNWKAFQTYLEDGHLSMDNNLSERQMRKVVLGRANWIFCGSENGAKRAAMIYSFICTCRLLEIDPYQYFNDVLKKILVWPKDRLSELTPVQWKKAQVSPK